MIAGLAIRLIGLGVPAKLAKPLVWALLIIAVVAALFIAKALYDKSVIEDHEAKRENEILRDTRNASEDAADERANDRIETGVQLEELQDANKDADDGLTPRQRRGCIILRQQGEDLARYPACRGLAD